MYSGVRDIFRRYWTAYGGWGALLTSAYLHASIFLTAITFNEWTKPEWWTHVYGILPNLLGFTVGGFTIFLGIGSEEFREGLSKSNGNGKYSMLLQISASYVHFIVIQTVAIICSLIAQATNFPPPDWLWNTLIDYGIDASKFFKLIRYLGWGFSYLMFLYALCLVLAACMAIFRTATWAQKS